MLADDDDEPSIDELIYEPSMCDGPSVRTTKFVDVAAAFFFVGEVGVWHARSRILSHE